MRENLIGRNLNKMRLGIYTGGGPAPGLNAAIWTVIQEAKKNDVELFGFCEGARGIYDENNPEVRNYKRLSEKSELLVYLKGGTFLGTSRVNPKENKKEFKEALEELEIDSLITIGGDDTASAALTYQTIGIPTNHVAKTIDNDVWGTERTFGFETVVTLGRDDANALAEDARSTGGIYVSEVMGRDAGHITFGMFEGSAADVALLPEIDFDINELVKYLEDKDSALVLAAEGASDEKLADEYTSEREKMRDILKDKISEDLIKKHLPVPERDPFGNVKKGGIAKMIVAELKKRFPDRRIRQTPDLGYQYRCANPIPSDIRLAQRMARYAFSRLMEGEGGIMGGLSGNEIVRVPLEDVVGKTRTVPEKLYKPYLADGGLLIHY